MERLGAASGSILADSGSMAHDSDHLLAACRRIAEDSLYTAQAHFEMASQKGRRASFWLVLLPSLVGFASGLAVAIGAPGWVGAFAACAGIVSAVATFLGVAKEATAHEIAGKLLTQLRHEARALCDTYAPPDMPRDLFAAQVRALQDRYRAFVASLPLTDDKAFTKAQAKIQSGTFRYDSESPTALPGTAQPSLPAPKKDRE